MSFLECPKSSEIVYHLFKRYVNPIHIRGAQNRARTREFSDENEFFPEKVMHLVESYWSFFFPQKTLRSFNFSFYDPIILWFQFFRLILRKDQFIPIFSFSSYSFMYIENVPIAVTKIQRRTCLTTFLLSLTNSPHDYVLFFISIFTGNQWFIF